MSCLRLIICLVCFGYLNGAAALTPRYAAIVIDANSGRVLEQDDADKICHPASLTKMMTLYMVFEALNTRQIQMSTQIPISSHAARQAPSKLGLRPGEYVSIETAIKALVTKSANDVSAALGEYLGGSEANFALMMTRKAKSLGMKNTIFRNASGLPHPQQVTTARDMATLSRSLYLHFPKDYRHFRLQAFHHRGKVHRNHNHLLGKVHGLDGIKTGWVASSGFNLAASAVRAGPGNKPVRLIAVVLGGPNRYWRDDRVKDLLEANFQKVGLGHRPFVREMDEDQDDDAEVTTFLKESVAKSETAKAPVRPTLVNWSPPPSRPKPHHPPETDDWGVQLGTYTSLKEARLKAKKTLMILKSGEISTPKVSKGKKSFYGARVLRLTKTKAETACKKFAPKGKGCHILASY
ncbi:MAG: D-alanyl-D-alanine carboxypeptidase [Alphaproteobacteria bacterium]|jgi:D-alanyl-D-alanine carboxypeptidase|nr:D-alanyl-D-alanine carboxypeptidase [Alphaproteobacteria bacterium]